MAVDEPGFLQAVTECRYPISCFGRGCGIKETDHRYRRSLRTRRERPRSRAAEQRDEVASPHHSITSSALASSVGGTLRPSIRAVSALMTRSNLLDCTTGRSAGLAPLRMRPA